MHAGIQLLNPPCPFIFMLPTISFQLLQAQRKHARELAALRQQQDRNHMQYKEKNDQQKMDLDAAAVSKRELEKKLKAEGKKTRELKVHSCPPALINTYGWTHDPPPPPALLDFYDVMAVDCVFGELPCRAYLRGLMSTI
jgi:hypothetical protein